MALPKSLRQPFRRGQLVVGAGFRGYFAPFNSALASNQTSSLFGPTIYDLNVQGRFIDGVPPGWFDLGWMTKVKITPGSKVGQISSGYRGAVRAQFRGQVAEKVSAEFMEMSRMALKIASGTQVFNLLATTQVVNSAGPLSASGTTAVAMGSGGYLPNGLATGPTVGLPTLLVPAGSGANFPAGSYVVCDLDYTANTFGFIGPAGANLFPGQSVDVDFIRKTSDFVAGVVQVVPTATGGQDALVLSAPFVGGGNNGLLATAGFGPTSPAAGSKVQAVTGYTTREGGTYISEFSAIFTLDTEDQSQIVIYYPHLSIDAFTGWNSTAIPEQGTTDQAQFTMPFSYNALAFDDPYDGETVVRYAAYFPSAGKQIQI